MIKEYRVTCDLFTIPLKDDKSLLYAPRVGFICQANRDVLDLLVNVDSLKPDSLNEMQINVLDHLEVNGVLNGTREREIKKYTPGKYTPTMVTLFPTNQCNLRCIYCYASAGENKPLAMEWRYAESAINAIVRNAITKGENKVTLGFHGGGEPLFRWDFIKKAVHYAEKECRNNKLKLTAHSATNGLLSEKQLDWITRHFSDLNISFDGLPRVQDHNRPLPNGEGSYKYIEKTLKFLDKQGFSYGIRSTFSDYNIDLMEESYDFIVNNFSPRTIHFEPVFHCGRCKTSKTFHMNLEKFAQSFHKIEAKHRNKKMRLTYSGSRLESLTNSFCGVTRDSFTITPEGFITSCFEITTTDDPKSEYFYYGRIDDGGNVVLDENKRKYLHKLTVENLAYCKDCFAKWHCAGDCVAKIGHGELHGERGHDRCVLNRQMMKDKLVSILKTNSEKCNSD